jgi:signal transduction histidine kinase
VVPGLGLAIVRRIADAMNAQLGVTNVRDTDDAYWGAEFLVEAEFPVDEELEATPPTLRPLTGRTIAVISSSPVVRAGRARPDPRLRCPGGAGQRFRSHRPGSC